MERTPVISLGAGVQSSTLLRMADAGEFGVVPELAVFADTGAEPQAVYDHLDALEREVSIPIIRASAGNLREDALKGVNSTGNSFVGIPFYHGASGLGRRQCTREYKLSPIYKAMREQGLKSVEMWIGISMDEVQRMKPARVKWVKNRWPLIEKNVTRAGCLDWHRRHELALPPRSACTFCPLHHDRDWRDLRDNSPEEWEGAVEFERELRKQPRMAENFLHRSLVPLDEVDLSTPEDRGQISLLDECEGLCGV
jgi:hypothetical protein